MLLGGRVAQFFVWPEALEPVFDLLNAVRTYRSAENSRTCRKLSPPIRTRRMAYHS
jgi:hypothetical protein